MQSNQNSDLKKSLINTNSKLYSANFLIAGIILFISIICSFFWGRSNAHLGPGSRGSGDYTFIYIAFSLSIMCSGILKLLNLNSLQIERASTTKEFAKAKTTQKIIIAILTFVIFANIALLYIIHSVFKL